MNPQNTPFDTTNVCPDCESKTSVVKLGAEPSREICGRFGCEWSGKTLEGGEH